MFKLTVVGGPIRGKAYRVKDGENSIGRVTGNDIVLTSSQVSKKHCVLVVSNSEVIVRDAGSANGTFVNGILTKLKKLVPGDRISVGEFVLELSRAETHRPKSSSSGGGDLIPFPSAGMPAGTENGFSPPMVSPGALPPAQEVPKADAPPVSLLEKAKFFFEKNVLNFVYNLNEKHEWRTLLVGLTIVLTVGASVLSVYPVLERAHDKLLDESINRALSLARQMVDRNAPFIYEKLETKVDVSYVEKEPGVVAAYVVDMEGRVLAPGRKLNQYLTEPNEAAFSAASRTAFYTKDSLERRVSLYGNIVAVAVPVKIFSAANGKNVSVALGLVFFDNSLVLFDQGSEAFAYIQALILAAIVGVAVFFTIYRLTLRPLAALNDDLDLFLKGGASGLERKFKMEEISPLLQNIQAVMSRAGGSSGSGSSTMDQEVIETTVASLKSVGDRMKDAGMLVFAGDRRILHLNAFMEEITGIRVASSVGSEISTVARDSAFISFIEDILGRTMVGGEPVTEDFEFSGTMYQMECSAFGKAGLPGGYVLTATKREA